VVSRRQFLLAAAAAPVAFASPVEDLWGGPVLDIHAHTRNDPNGNAAHCDGAGISHAILLTWANQLHAAKAAQAAHPGRFYISASSPLKYYNAAADLTNAVKAGAIAFGELKDPVQADGPELQHFYALAAELDVPILVHFQEYPNSPEGVFFANGIKNMPKMLEVPQDEVRVARQQHLGQHQCGQRRGRGLPDRQDYARRPDRQDAGRLRQRVRGSIGELGKQRAIARP
jgi:hypothetical protein